MDMTARGTPCCDYTVIEPREAAGVTCARVLRVTAVAWCIGGSYLADRQWCVLDRKVVDSNGDRPPLGALPLPHRPLLQAKPLQA